MSMRVYPIVKNTEMQQTVTLYSRPNEMVYSFQILKLYMDSYLVL
jgi:hypothetical protein